MACPCHLLLWPEVLGLFRKGEKAEICSDDTFAYPAVR